MKTITMQKLRNYLNPIDIHGALWPMIFINHMIGTIPFKWIENNQQYKLTLYGIFNFAFTNVLFTVSLVYSVLSGKNYVTFFFTLNIARNASLCLLLLFFVGIVTTYSCSLFRRRKLIKLILMVNQTDKRLRKINVRIDYRFCVTNLLRKTLFHLTFFGFYLGFNYMLQWAAKKDQHFSEWVSYFLPHFVLSSVQFKFVCILMHINYRIKLLNQVGI